MNKKSTWNRNKKSKKQSRKEGSEETHQPAVVECFSEVEPSRVESTRGRASISPERATHSLFHALAAGPCYVRLEVGHTGRSEGTSTCTARMYLWRRRGSAETGSGGPLPSLSNVSVAPMNLEQSSAAATRPLLSNHLLGSFDGNVPLKQHHNTRLFAVEAFMRNSHGSASDGPAALLLLHLNCFVSKIKARIVPTVFQKHTVDEATYSVCLQIMSASKAVTMEVVTSRPVASSHRFNALTSKLLHDKTTAHCNGFFAVRTD